MRRPEEREAPGRERERERERKTDTDTVYCEAHRPIHKEDRVGDRGGVNARYTSALIFNDSMDEEHCPSDSTHISLHIE